ncbi:nucleoside/nucleotide kinase family protein [Promicromonospora vindobonensis]|uniref:Nucleoside/nucleotide kinase family protein n=1 Tax=Promicromonospora vindobonensis TaxID=195748 RepID=A0ABW5VYN0_9MICO
MTGPLDTVRAHGLPDPLDALVDRASALVPAEGRAVLGIAGSPGAGKTSLAVRLTELLNARFQEGRDGSPGPFAAHLPMDGFHLAESTLGRLGRLDRKGAIDTFDGWGFVALLERLRAETQHTVYAPGFDRRVEEPIAGEIAVEPGTRLVVVEGNYLLATDDPWARVKGLLDESWFCSTADDVRADRLVARHQEGGRSEEDARAWAEDVDRRNAVLIEATRSRADLIVSGDGAGVPGGRSTVGG